MSSRRIEADILGNVSVPEDALYGSFTTRAMANFQISGTRIHPLFIKTLAEVKRCAAETNNELGILDEDLLKVIKQALDEVVNGKHGEMFNLDVFQAGAGTPWNMNINEVAANRANQKLGKPLGSYDPVHPNDHVNMSQSSNDVIPNTIRLTALKLLEPFFDSLKELSVGLREKSSEFSYHWKSARTHARDAVPILLGKEFAAYRSMVEHHEVKIRLASESLHELSLGGTAVGTGVNTPSMYSRKITARLRSLTGFEVRTSRDLVEKTQFASDFLQLMDVLSALCVDLVKMNNDLMLMSSGPRTGLKEIDLPEVEPGSSIMPGKVNPSILEAVNMVCFQIQGNRAVVEKAAQSGLFDLNVYTPLIAFNLLNSIEWLTNTLRILNKRCIRGITANPEVLYQYLKDSNALATLLSPVIGYEAAARLARKAVDTGSTVLELAVKEGLATREEIEKILDESMEA